MPGSTSARERESGERAATYTRNLGLVNSFMGRYDEMVASIANCADLLGRQMRENPDVPAFRAAYLFLTRAFLERLMFFGRRDEWARIRQGAIAVAEGMPGQTADDLYARAVQQAGLIPGTNAGLFKPTEDDLRLSAELADQAMATLQQAAAAGWRDPVRSSRTALCTHSIAVPTSTP